MRRTAFLLAAILTVSGGCSADPPGPPLPDWTADMQAAADANNRFAFDLYGKLRDKPGNVFFSPSSVHAALAMTAAGANGPTRDEMLKVLHVAAADKLPATGELRRYYSQPRADFELSVANAVWGQKGVAWRPAFLGTLAGPFGAALSEADFARDPEGERLRVNTWAADQTRGKVKDLIPAGVVTGRTRMVLANAIYFKGRWADQFDPKRTRDEAFKLADGSTVQVPMMHRTGGFRLYGEPGPAGTWEPAFQVAEVPYKGGELAMVFVVPGKPDGLPALEKQLTADAVTKWLAAAEAMKSHNPIAVPKFKFDAPADLKPHLHALGMVAAFDKDRADLSGMSDEQLYVAFVQHKAFVDVNEEGTEAAAATAAGAVLSSAPRSLRVDRPFVFLIRDTKRGTVLFVGRVEKP